MEGYSCFAMARTDSTEAQTINWKLMYGNIFTTRDANEYALGRAQSMVITNKQALEQLKITRPELF